jgi:DNA repair exonuclease SbcCD ATPase subunit
MKILSVHLENFASYETLDFTVDDLGLVLVHGATGSGKSTLADAVPWILFGITAKGGKADEVVSWNGGKTYGYVELEINGKYVQIHRYRKPNDLFFRTEDNTDANPTRGKDAQDTQRMVNELLVMNADLYLAGAYYHEFSNTAQFFTTTAKNRREITEQLVDLSLPVKLQEKIKIQTKEISAALTALEQKTSNTSAKLEMLDGLIKENSYREESWKKDIKQQLRDFETKAARFDEYKVERIKNLENKIAENINILGDANPSSMPKTNKCKECGSVSENLARVKLESVKNNIIFLQKHLEEVKKEQNVYKTQVTVCKNQKNPHTESIAQLKKDSDKNGELLAKYKKEHAVLLDRALNFELLSDVIQSFRSELIRNTIEDLESQTNQLLYNYFEGEISVKFTITDADKLDVTLQKDSNECAYTQLSKGQRCMLKLCFGVAVMKCIAQHHALSFDQLWFDEALDGLDDTNKMKAVKMLETLTADHANVYIVEHSETVKALIDRKYHVELVNGKSQIKED